MNIAAKIIKNEKKRKTYIYVISLCFCLLKNAICV